MIDEVAHYGIKATVRKVQVVSIAMLKDAAVGNFLCFGIVLAHTLAIIPFDAPVVNTHTICFREFLGTTDGQSTVVMTSDITVIFATFSEGKGMTNKQSVQYLKMGVFKHCTLI